MKKTMILGLTVTTIAFTPIYSVADDRYPASDFQPKVLFQDETAAEMPAGKAAFDPKYPATSFEPKIVFQDETLIKEQKMEVVFDPKYPAAYFQPKVIYP